MRIVLVFLSLFLSITALSAQKYKLKKDEILIDKVPVATLTKLDGSGLQDDKTFVLLNAVGDTTAKFIGTAQRYTKLPYEKEPRLAHYYMMADFRATGEVHRTAYTSVFFKRWMFMQLKAINALDQSGISEGQMGPLLKSLKADSAQIWLDTFQIVDARRQVNYKKVAADFGEHTKRDPGRLTFEENFVEDGNKKVGHIAIKKIAKLGNVYSVKRMNGLKAGKDIGTVFYSPKDGRYFFRYFGGDKTGGFEWFDVPGPASRGTYLKIGAKLIEEGYL